MAAKKPKKKQSIRNSEYYNTQKRFDQLYQDSLHGKRFTQLMDIITSEENIMLAYRSIKKNKGSKTKGTNNSTIVQMGEKTPDELISYVRKRLKNFHPHAVRRVEIPKPDGRLRPLGIPTIIRPVMLSLPSLNAIAWNWAISSSEKLSSRLTR